MKSSVVTPYIHGILVNIRIITADYRLRAAFHFRNTINRLIVKTDNEISKLGNKNIIYKIPCKCWAKYEGRLDEHRKKLEGKTDLLRLADHAWFEGHKIL